MADDIPPNLYNVLKKCVNGKIEEFSAQFSNNIDGQGYTGQVTFVTLTNKKSLAKQSLVIKQQFCLEGKPAEVMNGAYNNELYFYDVIWPTLQTFYTTETGKHFQYIAKSFGINREGVRAVALEDLRAEGFISNPKQISLENQHFEMLFKVYGVFHGISMAFKEKETEDYFNLIDKIQFGWEDVYPKMPLATQYLKYVVKKAQSAFDSETEKNIIEKLEQYEGRESEILNELLYEKSTHRVIKHGDCWNCNLLFKYNDNGQLQDLRLLDFQLIGSGTPVHDLAFCYYSGTNCFSNLGKYLKIYHNSLSETLKEFGLDIEGIYPFETLKEEWKKHCKFGLFFALMVYEQKFADPQAIPHFMEQKEFLPWNILDEKVNQYRNNVRDLIIHLYDNEFL